MEKHLQSPIIPQNVKGKSLDLLQQVKEAYINDAIKTYQRAYHRLLNPPIWHSIAGKFSATMELFSEDHTNLKRLAEVGDFCRINILGPGLTIGEGYDWVMVDAIEENMEAGADASIALRLKTSFHPKKKNEGVAHFFEEQATSTFIIKRIGNVVSTSYHGRNEVANSKDVPLADKVRNNLVAAGAEAGLSKLQWTALIEGFLAPEIGG